MKTLYILPFLIGLSWSFFASAQEDATEETVEISTVEALLALVKEGKTEEQAANTERENQFLANRDKQASILAAEKSGLKLNIGGNEWLSTCLKNDIKSILNINLH